MSYIKQVFDAVTLDHAKHIVLTSDPNNPDKFEKETSFLIDVIKKNINISEDDKVLDFGCGMGRVSRELINTFNCNVIGVDISESMRKFAMLYVRNPKKFTPLPEYTEKNSIDVGISTFVLQHVEDPEKEIQNLYNVIKSGGYFVLVNENERFVPSAVDKNNYIIWNNDGVNVFDEVEKYFSWEYSVKYMDTNTEINFYRK